MRLANYYDNIFNILMLIFITCTWLMIRHWILKEQFQNYLFKIERKSFGEWYQDFRYIFLNFLIFVLLPISFIICSYRAVSV